MRRIVIASHHRFAAGLRDTLKFVGVSTDMIAVCTYVDDASLDEQLDEVFSRFSPSDSVLVMTDMLQGSVNQAFQRFLGDNVFLVTGVNVPCALELAVGDGPLTDETVRSAVEHARTQLIFVNDYIADVGDDDE